VRWTKALLQPIIPAYAMSPEYPRAPGQALLHLPGEEDVLESLLWKKPL
jgi:hypothetical protein